MTPRLMVGLFVIVFTLSLLLLRRHFVPPKPEQVKVSVVPMPPIERHLSRNGKYAAVVIPWGKMTGKSPRDPGASTMVMVMRLLSKPQKGKALASVRLTGFIPIPTLIGKIGVFEQATKKRLDPEVQVQIQGEDGYRYVLAAREGWEPVLVKIDPKTKKQTELPVDQSPDPLANLPTQSL